MQITIYYDPNFGSQYHACTKTWLYINPIVLVLLNTYVIWYLLLKASKSMDTKTGIFAALVICYCISKSHYMQPVL